MANRLSKAYLLTKVLTANNHEVVIYLFEGAVSHLHRATQALRKGRRGDCGKAIDRVIGILIELSSNLNFNTGGQLALRLEAIYNYLIESLTLANSKGDDEALAACESILDILRDAWKQAADAAGANHIGSRDQQLSISA